VNGDHYVTFDEIVSTLTTNEDALHRIKKTQAFNTQLKQFIESNDGDNNKKLDENEFVQAMKRFAITEPMPVTETDDGEITRA